MLNELKRFFKTTSTEQLEVTNDEGNASMTVDNATQDPQPNAANAELTAQLAAVTSALADKEAALTKLTADFTAMQSTLANIEKAKEELIIKAKEEKLAARKAKVELAIGTTKAEEILNATNSLDDASFESVLSAFSASFELEAKSKMFVETGVTPDNSADASADEKPVHFNTYIKKD